VLVVNADEVVKYLSVEDAKGLILFSWHNKILLSPIIIGKIFKKFNKYVLISGKSEGRIIKKVSKKFGITSIKTFNVKSKNSKSFSNIDARREELHLKYGKNLYSLRKTIKILDKNNIFLLAADAIKGHAFNFSSSILPLVKKTNSAITFGAISYKRYKQLNTWDKLQIPYPFNKICIEFGDIYMGREFTDNMDKILTKSLNDALEKTKL
jgi:lysophospholipid acyltransferase (LPLAT)-like uncharacterized protein